VNEAKANFASLVATRPVPCQLQQELFGAAFGRASGIGHDPRASVYGLGAISDSTLRSHLGANFNASSLVVVGSNVEHKAFHDLVESYLGNVPAAAPVATPASQFTGGYSEHRVDGETVSISVGFPADTLRAASPAFTVLSHVFGGHSGSFYGSRSLLKEELAKPENAFVKSLTFNHKALSDAGLIALTGKVAAKDADRLINLIASLFKTAAAGGISEDHLRRGVSSSVVDLYSFVDDKWKSNHYAGHHLLATGSAGDVSASGKALAGVTAADVASAVKAAIKGPVAVGAVGNTIYVPALPKIASKFA